MLHYKHQQLYTLEIYHFILNKMPSKNSSQEQEMSKTLSWELIMMVILVDSVSLCNFFFLNQDMKQRNKLNYQCNTFQRQDWEAES